MNAVITATDGLLAAHKRNARALIRARQPPLPLARPQLVQHALAQACSTTFYASEGTEHAWVVDLRRGAVSLAASQDQ
jgi:hypothetical protein